MIIDSITEKEYHANGNLKYVQTIGVLSKAHAHLYENRRVHPDGYEWIRIGYNAKFKENGKIEWELHYSQRGELLTNRSYQVDLFN